MEETPAAFSTLYSLGGKIAHTRPPEKFCTLLYSKLVSDRMDQV